MKIKKILLLVFCFSLLFGCGKKQENLQNYDSSIFDQDFNSTNFNSSNFESEIIENIVNETNSVNIENDRNIEVEPTMNGKEFVNYLKEIGIDDYSIKVNRDKESSIFEDYISKDYIYLEWDKNPEDYEFEDRISVKFSILESNEMLEYNLRGIQEIINDKDNHYYILGDIKDFEVIDDNSISVMSENSMFFESIIGNLKLEINASELISEKEFKEVCDKFYTNKFKDFKEIVSIDGINVVDFYTDVESKSLEELDSFIFDIANSGKYNKYVKSKLLDEGMRISGLAYSKNNSIENMDGESINDFVNYLKTILPEDSELYFHREVTTTYDSHLNYLDIDLMFDPLEGFGNNHLKAYPMTKEDIEFLRTDDLEKQGFDGPYYLDLGNGILQENVSSYINTYKIFSGNVCYVLELQEEETIDMYKDIVDGILSYDKIVNAKDMINFYQE